MKTILILVFTILSFVLMVYLVKCHSKENSRLVQDKQQVEKDLFMERLKAKADSALFYAKSKGFDSKHCILIDFKVHSGKNRLFVWDFANDTIKYAGLCCHGYGNSANRSTPDVPKFSNVAGSLCSSLGRYKVGARSYSSWGINVHYKLHGLDKTNSNAFKRIVVLHSHTPVSEKEIYPYHLPLGYSQGCPVVSDETMRKVDDLLKGKKSPVLLWIYY